MRRPLHLTDFVVVRVELILCLPEMLYPRGAGARPVLPYTLSNCYHYTATLGGPEHGVGNRRVKRCAGARLTSPAPGSNVESSLVLL